MKYILFLLGFTHTFQVIGQVTLNSSEIAFIGEQTYLGFEQLNLRLYNLDKTSVLAKSFQTIYQSYGHSFRINGNEKVWIGENTVQISDDPVNRPNSGTADLIPLAYGRLKFSNDNTSIEKSTGNFSLGSTDKNVESITIKVVFDTDFVEVDDLVVIASVFGKNNKCAAYIDSAQNTIALEIGSLTYLLATNSARPAVATVDFFCYKP